MAIRLDDFLARNPQSDRDAIAAGTARLIAEEEQNCMQNHRFTISFTVPDPDDEAYAKLVDSLFRFCDDAESVICVDGVVEVDFHRQDTSLGEAMWEAFGDIAVAFEDILPPPIGAVPVGDQGDSS